MNQKIMILMLGLLIIMNLKQLLTFFDVISILRFYKQENKRSLPDGLHYPAIIVVIPVLREQSTIEGTLSYFSSFTYPALHIAIVTTAREATAKETPTTIDVVKELTSRFHFNWVHFPSSNGTKADQLNYVIARFAELFPTLDAKRSFFAFYDADSRPHPATFAHFARVHSEYPERNIFQQSSIFYENFSRLGTSASSKIRTAFLQAQAVLQTRFTLGYEVPRFMNQLSFYNKRLNWRALLGSITYAHCVGHGLFVRASFLQEVSFPNEAMEDMFYGFVLNCLNEPITPIPVLTNSEMPAQLKTLFYQRSRWFLGPARFKAYFSYVRAHFTHRSSLMRCIVIALFCFHNMINWALTSLIFLGIMGGLIYGVTVLLWGMADEYQAILFLLSALFLLLYLGSVAFLIQNFTLSVKLADPAKQAKPIPLNRHLRMLLVFPLVLLFHSFPAYYCLYDMVFRRAQLQHSKTERI
jgi:cellulose synthase/poly-beta-1,6-N-acetylglucosamine synthase-like glycosyltransferase